MYKLLLPIFIFCGISLNAQFKISGKLVDDKGGVVSFANILINENNSDKLLKVESSDLDGKFEISLSEAGPYQLRAIYLGYENIIRNDINTNGSSIEIGELKFVSSSVQLETAIVTAKRVMVEVKPDRTVFNVQGTVNSTGENAIGLLRKAPGVLVDNNNGINVLGRSGVLVYIDGKRLPLAGQDLSNYLNNLVADQIDRIEIISNPGSQFEAEGNAGIIDIRLKKDKNLGGNGTISTTGSMGHYGQFNTNFSGNYRTKKINLFGGLGGSRNNSLNNMKFINYQNELKISETNRSVNRNQNANLRAGIDYFLNDKNTIGLLFNSNIGDGNSTSINRAKLSTIQNPNLIDSILLAENFNTNDNTQNTFNINYVFLNKNTKVNIDLDYGIYRTDNSFNQPNLYYTADESTLLTSVLTEYTTPTDIDIATAKFDYETPILGGNVATGLKFSSVATSNTYEFFNIKNNINFLDSSRSNTFDYDELVYAAYVNYNRPFTKKINFSGGLRAELTDAEGNLQAYDPSKQEPTVLLNYLKWFPSAGLTYSANPMNVLSINVGRRINRPDYNVLNPFRIQLSELSFSKGNARLSPEIVNNLEIGYTYKYMYNFKLAYSRTNDQITRLIGPDDKDPRAGFITWANLATQDVYSANFSAPIQITKWWSLFGNASANFTNNQANYGDGGKVDVQAFSYSFYQQSTFTLPKKWQAEISGWYSGPGIWGGVFLYDPSYSLNLGLQRKFFNNQLNAKINFSDVTFQSYWSGVSEFNGLRGEGRGSWDSRRVALSLSYNFGNANVKSRRRSTGIEDEAKRVGSGN